MVLMMVVGAGVRRAQRVGAASSSWDEGASCQGVMRSRVEDRNPLVAGRDKVDSPEARPLPVAGRGRAGGLGAIPLLVADRAHSLLLVAPVGLEACVVLMMVVRGCCDQAGGEWWMMHQAARLLLLQSSAAVLCRPPTITDTAQSQNPQSSNAPSTTIHLQRPNCCLACCNAVAAAAQSF